MSIIYQSTITKLLAGLQDENQSVLFEMDDGSLKTISEVKDFHGVKIALETEVVVERILVELFGQNPTTKSGVKKKHFEAFMTLFKVVFDNTTPAVIKSVSEEFDLQISRKDDNEGKIASELLRE
jgi:hypothetical protein